MLTERGVDAEDSGGVAFTLTVCFRLTIRNLRFGVDEGEGVGVVIGVVDPDDGFDRFNREDFVSAENGSSGERGNEAEGTKNGSWGECSEDESC